MRRPVMYGRESDATRETRTFREEPVSFISASILRIETFCFQYPEWKKNIALASGWEAHGDDIGGIVRGNIPSNPTERCALVRAYYSQRIELIDSCIAELKEPAVGSYLLKGVTEGFSYNNLRARGCPCGSEMYYNLYHKFFWILSRERA